MEPRGPFLKHTSLASLESTNQLLVKQAAWEGFFAMGCWLGRRTPLVRLYVDSFQAPLSITL